MAANFIQRSRHGSVYYFRRRIPDDLHELGLPRQIFRTLHTSDRAEAVLRVRQMAAECDRLFSRIRAMAKKKQYVDKWGATMELGNLGSLTFVDVKPDESADVQAVIVAAINAAKAGSPGAMPSPTETKSKPAPASKGRSIAAALEVYWAESTLAPSSKQRYDSVLRHVEKYFGADTKLSAITQEVFANYSATIKANPEWEVATQNSYITIGGVFLQWCANRFDEANRISTGSLKGRW
jgi:hypothetical protein